MIETFGFAVEKFEKWSNYLPSLHSHDVLEINYLARGRATQDTAGYSGELKEGMISIINYGLEHSIITNTSDIDIINIYIDIKRVNLPKLEDQFIDVLRQIMPIHHFSINNINKIVTLNADDQVSFEALLRCILDENKYRNFGYKELINDYFKMFLIKLCRFAEDKGFSRTICCNHKYHKIEQLLNYLDNDCHKHIDLNSLADKTGLNKYYLCRKFHEITGKTIFSYLLSKRLERAMYELRITDKKIIDIALDCGFGNISNFNRCFKKAVSQTPTQYRKTNQTTL